MGTNRGLRGWNSAVSLVLALFLLLSLLPPVSAPSWTDTTNQDFSQGIHENTENVNDDVRLVAGYTQGRFTSRVFDAGETVWSWDTLSWSQTIPKVNVENDNVGTEPDPLVDGESRRGEIVGGSLLDTRENDGIYENVAEENVGIYTYAGGETVYEGGTSGISGAQVDDGTYENMYEYNLSGITNGTFDENYDGWQVRAENYTDADSTYGWENADGNGVIYGYIHEDDWDASLTWWQSFDYAGSVPPDRATLKFAYEVPDWGADGGEWIKFKVLLENTTPENILIFENTYTGNDTVPWTTIENNIANLITATGTYTVYLQAITHMDESSFSDDHIKHRWDNVSVEINTRMKVQHSITDIPTADNYWLEIEYYTAGDSEAVSLYLYDFSTESWENVGVLQGGSESNPELFTYTLTGTSYISGGEVKVRYVQPDTDDTQTSLMVDYCRVKSVVYALRWGHRIENVADTYGAYELTIRGYTSGDGENVGVYIWNSTTSSWEFLDNLDNTGVKTITKSIPGAGITDYLVGENVHIKYEDYDNKDSTKTIVHIDLCTMQEYNTFGEIKFQVATSADNVNWTPFVGPDSTSQTYFEVSPASLENIGDNRYFRYRAYFSSSSEEYTGADGPLLHDVTIDYTLPPEVMPTITTLEAKGIQWDSAVLTARIVYGSLDELEVRFAWRKAGTTEWNYTPWETCSRKEYGYELTGLSENTGYEFEAQTKFGTGGIRTFRTLPENARATTQEATLVTDSSATLNASIYYGKYDSVTMQFYYRESGGAWENTPPETVTSTTYSKEVTGLSSGSTYEFYAYIEFNGGKDNDYAGRKTFTTFGSSAEGLNYDGLSSRMHGEGGWNGIRATLSGVRGFTAQILISRPFYGWITLRVENATSTNDLLHLQNIRFNGECQKRVTLSFEQAISGEVYVEIYDPYGYHAVRRGSGSIMPVTKGKATFTESYARRGGDEVVFTESVVGVNVLEVFT